MKRLPLIALAALPLTAGVVLAGTVTAGAPARSAPAAQAQPQTPQPGPRTPSGTNYGDVYLQKLAATLGVTVDKLRAAAVSAGNATIDQAVKAGDVPSDRAAEMKAHLQDHPLGFGRRGFGGPGGRGGPGHDYDHGPRGALPGSQGQAAPASGTPSGT
ncbi:hypothetical protein [Deinococcus multiflagellatus]|uniref:Uncharacterized protein n=1 Tax=Deinococcus multiflagellatus TaxID=1656887 RepID=A0ABW1ZH96_9DEIO|nr:hypothetical protein [Deinococcus multiflagellatus]MBZ9711897.1 hypothetical protein [Deinococcus multiflagellatus]